MLNHSLKMFAAVLGAASFSLLAVPTIAQQSNPGGSGSGSPSQTQGYPDQGPNQPLTPGAADPGRDAGESMDMSIEEVLRNSMSFEMLNALLATAAIGEGDADMVGQLGEDGDYVVLAPTDEAFAALPEGTLRRLVQPENRELLVEILSNHIMESSEDDGQMQSIQQVAIGTPIRASNGTIYAINRLILPSELQSQLQSMQPMAMDLAMGQMAPFYSSTTSQSMISAGMTSRGMGATGGGAGGVSSGVSSQGMTDPSMGSSGVSSQGVVDRPSSTPTSGQTGVSDAGMAGGGAGGGSMGLSQGMMGSSMTSPSTPSSGISPTQTPPNNSTRPTVSAANSTQGGTSSILQLAQNTGSFNTFVQAVQASGLEQQLNSNESYTIFAPTDQAFASLPPRAIQALLRPENRALLNEILSYHVAPGNLSANDIETGAVPNLSGGALAVRVTPDRIIINDGSITQPDLRAGNSVIHGISRVLIPPQLRDRLNTLDDR